MTLPTMKPRILIVALVAAGGCGSDGGTTTPTTGSLRVTASTTGEDPDPDGYTVTVGTESRALGVDGSVTFDDLDEGQHEVELSGLAANCSVAGANPRSATVSDEQLAVADFAVDCPGTMIEVNVATTGEDLDPDGYTVVVGSADRPIPIDGTITYDVAAGTYPVDLRDVAFNCTVGGDNPRDVTVAPGETVSTTFEVACAGPLAVIDGVRSPGEWDAATSVEVFAGATLFFMNDGVDLYLALEVDDGTIGADDRVEIRFDNTRNGVFDANEDNIAVSGTGAFSDMHSSATSWAIFDGQQDGAGAAGASGGKNFFEMVHPLNSGDPQDFALSSGDAVGYCLSYRMDGSLVSAAIFPAGCQFDGNDLSEYAELVVN